MAKKAATKADTAPAPKRGRPSKRETGMDGADGSTIVIRKYPNRRLYNTATSSYIKLDDIVDLIADDTPFVIEDAKTGENITRAILNQIIYERENGSDEAFHFPLEFQKQLIAMYGDSYSKMVPDYLTQSLSLFAQEREKMGEAMTKAVGTAVERNTRAMMEFSQALAKQNMDMFKRSWSMFLPTLSQAAPDGDQSPSDAPPVDQGGRDQDLKDMQAQIDALQNRLKDMS
ncbi:MAG: polyhydroxyalkanoate synthesis repressor PhaR [Pseudomonadota bacterium]